MMKTSLAFPSERPTTANTERKVPKIPLNMFSICSLPLVLCVKNERAKYLPPTLNFCIHSLCNLLVGSERSVSHVRAWFQTRTSQVVTVKCTIFPSASKRSCFLVVCLIGLYAARPPYAISLLHSQFSSTFSSSTYANARTHNDDDVDNDARVHSMTVSPLIGAFPLTCISSSR